ncbi:MAG: tetratricopeptide repeat protein [Coxiellaceae bacterium]|nr:MAG: tetratricopeptide repeat protein [Coxiellaceae bacterium]
MPTLSPIIIKIYVQMLDRHQYSEVQQTAESILRNYPNESDVRLLLAKAYVAQRNYQAALEQAEYLLKQDSNNKDAYQIKGCYSGHDCSIARVHRKTNAA